MARDAAYYLTVRSNYFGRAVAARSILHSQVHYAVGLYDHAMRQATIEGVADGVLVRVEAVGLRDAKDALAEVLHEQVRILAVALASAIGDNGLSGGGQRNERILVALVAQLVALNALCFLPTLPQVSSSSKRPVRMPTIMRSCSSAQPRPTRSLGMSIMDAAKALLVAALFKTGGLHMNSKEPANTIGSVLTRRMAEVSDVVRVGRGTWGLKEWYPNRSFKVKDDEKKDDKKPQQEPGKAGFDAALE